MKGNYISCFRSPQWEDSYDSPIKQLDTVEKALWERLQMERDETFFLKKY